MPLLNNPDGRHRSIMNDEQILKYLKDILHENFEIEADRVTLDANLFDDLDLDSIDAVDLAIKLQEMTGKRIKPDEFKGIRTIGDVITVVHQLLAT
jgi:acyl carrier protein